MAKPTSDLTGLLLVDKEPGWTSHDVVAKARGITGQRKIGHTGTLDPMATGLLVLCLGRATRLVEYMTGHDKYYEGEIRLGVTTDTDDAEGTAIATYPVPPITGEDLDAIAARFTGPQLQAPPAYSAVKVEGKRAYAAARAGSPLDLQPRPITVHALQLRAAGPDRLAIEVHCGAGTYVRSLARDIGAAIGCGAHLSALRRTQAGRFDVAGAVTISEMAAIAGSGRLASILLPLDEGLLDHDAAILSIDHCRTLAAGGPVDVEPPTRGSEAARVYTTDGVFVAVGTIKSEGQIQPKKVLIDRIQDNFL